MIRSHHLLHPSSYVNCSSHGFIFFTTRSFAERARRLFSTSPSLGTIGRLVICVNGGLNSSGMIGKPLGVSFLVLHDLNARLQRRSSKEWKVITATLPSSLSSWAAS